MATVLEVVEGDIVRLDVDAIVNAAAPGLAGGTGVSRAIHAAAGPQLFEAAQELEPFNRGGAGVTPGFALPARWVVHTIGPVWITGALGEDKVLASCYRASLAEAMKVGARSVAFPAISTGAYRFPPDQAARIAVTTVRQVLAAHPDAFDRILFCCFDAQGAAHHRTALAAPANP